MTTDELWPRTPEYRYRVYTRVGVELRVIGAAPTPGGVGEALIAFHGDQKEAGRRLADLGRIGILDVCPEPRHQDGLGEWIVLPWSRNFGKEHR